MLRMACDCVVMVDGFQQEWLSAIGYRLLAKRVCCGSCFSWNFHKTSLSDG